MYLAASYTQALGSAVNPASARVAPQPQHVRWEGANTPERINHIFRLDYEKKPSCKMATYAVGTNPQIQDTQRISEMKQVLNNARVKAYARTIKTLGVYSSSSQHGSAGTEAYCLSENASMRLVLTPV